MIAVDATTSSHSPASRLASMPAGLLQDCSWNTRRAESGFYARRLALHIKDAKHYEMACRHRKVLARQIGTTDTARLLSHVSGEGEGDGLTLRFARCLTRGLESELPFACAR